MATIRRILDRINAINDSFKKKDGNDAQAGEESYQSKGMATGGVSEHSETCGKNNRTGIAGARRAMA